MPSRLENAGLPSSETPAPDRRTRGRAARARAAIVLFVGVILTSTFAFALTRSTDSPAEPVASGTLATGAPQSTVSPTTAARQATTPAPSITTTTLAEVPLPDPLPNDPYAPTPQVVLGQLEIPKLGVVGNLQEGITLTAINRGPGHWPGTPAPGGLGNMVIAGHRTTYTRPFNRLDELVAGDQVIFRTPSGTFTYAVRGVIIVPDANIGVAAASRAHTATLFACHPKGSATHRVVAKLALLNPDGTFVDSPEALPPVDAGADPVTGTTLLVRGANNGSSNDPLAGQA